MDRKKLACSCKDVTYGMIIDAVASGATTYEDVQRITRCATGCGRCKDFIEEFIRELVEERNR